MTLRAALFDMDGTLIDSKIGWLELREEIDLPWDGRPLLAQLAELGEDERAKGLEVLHRWESRGAAISELIDGAEDILNLLRAHGVACALVTNNSRANADVALERHGLAFDAVLTRDDGEVKPAPDLVLEALRRLGAEPKQAVFLGDAHLDLLAAQAAGIPRTILIGTPDWMQQYIPAGVEYTAVEKLYGVRVVNVRTAMRKGKPRRTGYRWGTTSHWKKAVVVLHEDDHIDLF